MAYKIAVASSDGSNVNLQFGKFETLRIYQVRESDGSFSFLEERKIKPLSKSLAEIYLAGCTCGQGFAERISDTVEDCLYFLVSQIGNRQQRLLKANNVNCIEAPYPIDKAVKKLNLYFINYKKYEARCS